MNSLSHSRRAAKQTTKRLDSSLAKDNHAVLHPPVWYPRSINPLLRFRQLAMDVEYLLHRDVGDGSRCFKIFFCLSLSLTCAAKSENLRRNRDSFLVPPSNSRVLVIFVRLQLHFVAGF